MNRNRWYELGGVWILGCLACGAAWSSEVVPLSTLDLTKMSAGWGAPVANLSVQSQPMSIAGRKFQQGVGTHAESSLWVDLQGGSQRFKAWVGVDDEIGTSPASIEFRVIADDETLFRSGVMRAGDAAKQVDIDLRGRKLLQLIVRSAGDGVGYDHANWAEAVIETTGPLPRALDVASVTAEPKVLLTPKPGPQPKINGPRLFGARPGHPFVYRIPCTGKRPIQFHVDNLPAGLQLEAETGIVRGTAPTQTGEYRLTLQASNEHGKCSKEFTLVVGDTLALTPPMGWNSWYIHYFRVDEQHMRDAAETMIDSGMADFGYMYVNIDDCWMKQQGDEPYRDESGAVLPNAKFPDMRGMVDAIHEVGLRAGTYISPGPWTCAGYVGSYQHEEADAKQFAEWGFDFLKYDWCSYESVATGEGRERFTKPYQQMGDLLKKQNRDGASSKQDEAIAKLREAKEKLEEILRQLREEERELLLAALEARFQKMLALQLIVYNGTVGLDKTPKAEWNDRHFARARELANQENEISLEAAKALELLKGEGSSVAFPEAIEQLRQDVLQVVYRLQREDVASLTQGIERDIIESLEELIEALQKEMEKAKKDKQKQQQQQQQQQQDKALVDKLAELKMLRSLQMRINRRTKRIGQEVETADEKVDKPDLLQQLQGLSGRQAKIQKATYDLSTGKNQ